jgi:hypothetical protein
VNGPKYPSAWQHAHISFLKTVSSNAEENGRLKRPFRRPGEAHVSRRSSNAEEKHRVSLRPLKPARTGTFPFSSPPHAAARRWFRCRRVDEPRGGGRLPSWIRFRRGGTSARRATSFSRGAGGSAGRGRIWSGRPPRHSPHRRWPELAHLGGSTPHPAREGGGGPLRRRQQCVSTTSLKLCPTSSATRRLVSPPPHAAPRRRFPTRTATSWFPSSPPLHLVITRDPHAAERQHRVFVVCRFPSPVLHCPLNR